MSLSLGIIRSGESFEKLVNKNAKYTDEMIPFPQSPIFLQS